MLIIQPGHNAPSVLNEVEMAMLNSKRLVDISVMDYEGNPVDIEEQMTNGGTEPTGYLYLDVYDYTNTIVYSESYWPVSIPDNRRIKHIGTGKYGITWGDSSGETNSSGAYLFAWRVRRASGEEEVFRVQLLEVYTPVVLSLLPRLRLQLDKSIKVINPEKFCTLGYSDSQLLLYLQAGLERINQAQPYVTFGMSNFPFWHGSELLIRCAVLEGLRSQFLFAVDTDIPQFSDSGHSFAITHAQMLKPMYDSLSSEISKDIREFKMHYINTGFSISEYRVGYGFYQGILAAPTGAYFRNYYNSNMPGTY
jgi:hypothetical protein